VISAPEETVVTSSSLQAIAKAVSARAKTKPPWVISKPLSMSSRMGMVTTARPGRLTTTVIPSMPEARSRRIMATLAGIEPETVTVRSLAWQEC
jgi:hypothetical protein